MSESWAEKLKRINNKLEKAVDAMSVVETATGIVSDVIDGANDKVKKKFAEEVDQYLQ